MDIQEDLEKVLERLAGVDSVIGGLVLDLQGNLLASFMPEIYEFETLEEFTKRLNDILESLKGLGIDQKETVINFDEIKLVIRSLEFGHLVIMCQTNVSTPLLNLSTNIAYNKVSEILESQYSPNKKNNPGSYAVTTSSSMTMSMKKIKRANESSTERKKLVPKVLLQSLEVELALIIGPAAKIIIKKAIKNAGGEGHSLDIESFNNFISMIESKISDSEQLQYFQSKVKDLSRSITKI